MGSDAKPILLSSEHIRLSSVSQTPSVNLYQPFVVFSIPNNAIPVKPHSYCASPVQTASILPATVICIAAFVQINRCVIHGHRAYPGSPMRSLNRPPKTVAPVASVNGCGKVKRIAVFSNLPASVELSSSSNVQGRERGGAAAAVLIIASLPVYRGQQLRYSCNVHLLTALCYGRGSRHQWLSPAMPEPHRP